MDLGRSNRRPPPRRAAPRRDSDRGPCARARSPPGRSRSSRRCWSRSGRRRLRRSRRGSSGSRRAASARAARCPPSGRWGGPRNARRENPSLRARSPGSSSPSRHRAPGSARAAAGGARRFGWDGLGGWTWGRAPAGSTGSGRFGRAEAYHQDIRISRYKETGQVRPRRDSGPGRVSLDRRAGHRAKQAQPDIRSR